MDKDGIVVVTGGASGIGHATAALLLAQGWRVALIDRDADALERARAALPEARDTTIHALDVTDETGVASTFSTLAGLGRLAGLVNSAGIGAGIPLAETSAALFRRILDVNVVGSFLTAQAAAPLMAATGGGAIVHIGSVSGIMGNMGRTAYGASKGAIVTMTKVMAVELAESGIRVNAVAPGYTRTDLVDELIRRGRVDPALAASRIPLGRMAAPAEIAACIVHLAGPGARGTIGSMLIVDGAGSAYGGSDPAPVQRGAAPATPPPGQPGVVVTGASTSLGRACVRRLEADGVAVVAIDTDATGRAIEDAAARWGRLDGLINAAGTDALADPSLSLEQCLSLHLEQHFLAAQPAGRIMLAQGYGAVVNLTSAAGLLAGLGPPNAAAAAAAVTMLTRTMACEWGGSGVRVTTLAAGGLTGSTPLGQCVHPEDVAATAAFLISPQAAYVTGATLVVDGGVSACGAAMA